MKIVDKINELDIDIQQKLMERVERQYDNKVMEKVSAEIDVNMVELSNWANDVEKGISTINSLFRKLCCVLAFTKEIRDQMDKIDVDLQRSESKFILDAS